MCRLRCRVRTPEATKTLRCATVPEFPEQGGSGRPGREVYAGFRFPGNPPAPYPRRESVDAWGWVWEFAEFQFLTAEEVAWRSGERVFAAGLAHSLVALVTHGSGGWQVGDRTQLIQEGEVVWVPEGSPHGVRVGARGCRAIAVRFTARVAGAHCLLSLLGFPTAIRDPTGSERGFHELVRLQHHQPGGWRQRASALVAELVLRTVHEHPDKLDPAASVRRLRALRWLCPVLHLADRSGPGIAVAAMAKALACSPTHLRRVFRECLGTSPHAWLAERRLKKAADLLVSTDQSVEQVARGIGYESLSHFHRAFKRRFGCTPAEYRVRTRVP